MNLRIRAAGAEDLKSAITLLSECELPTVDLDPQTFLHFLVAQAEGVDELVGLIGLEPFGQVGLLRSLAVSPRFRGKAVAQALIASLEHRARDQSIAELYLLTTTAASYFHRRGYEAVDRNHVPDAIRETREFSELCPDSAVVMKRRVGGS